MSGSFSFKEQGKRMNEATKVFQVKRVQMNRVTLSEDGWLLWHCPGCKTGHGVPVTGERAWSWNKSLTEPTLTLSVLVYSHKRHEEPDQPRCHIFMVNGKIQFLTDCGHELAGKTVEMEDAEA